MFENESAIKSLQRVKKEERPKIRKTLPELYRSVDLEGTIIDCNESYAHRLGYTVDEIIGMSLFQHTPEKDQKQMLDSFELWKKTGNVSNRKIKLITKQSSGFSSNLLQQVH